MIYGHILLSDPDTTQLRDIGTKQAHSLYMQKIQVAEIVEYKGYEYNVHLNHMDNKTWMVSERICGLLASAISDKNVEQQGHKKPKDAIEQMKKNVDKYMEANNTDIAGLIAIGYRMRTAKDKITFKRLHKLKLI